MKKSVFVGSRPYNAGVFENFLKQELGKEMMDSLKPQKYVIFTKILCGMFRVLVTTCLTHIAPPQLKLLRNYDLNTTELTKRQKDSLGYEISSTIPIWKAARCSRFSYKK